MLIYLAPLVVFGVVIFIHELGHFVAAKLTGVYAPRFAVGFGPALFRRRRGETEYVLAALPLGGYVRMASRHDADAALLEGGAETDGLKPGDAGYDPEAMMPFGPRAVPEHRWFESKSLAARLFILVAGVVMNMVLALVLYAGINVVYGVPVIGTRVVGRVNAPPGAPQLAQLQAGDTIAAVNGVAVRSWEDIRRQVLDAPAGPVAIRTQRGEVTVPVGTPGAPTAQQILRGIEFYIPPVIGQVVPGGAALRAGLRAGDTVVTIGHQPVRSWNELVERVSAAAGTDLPFEVRRGGKVVGMTVRPESTQETDPETKAPRTVGRIGVAIGDITVRQPMGFLEGISAGAQETWFVFSTIGGKLVTLQISRHDIGGPIAITRASVEAGRSGLVSVLGFLAMISVSVAVLNLLPIPILDGGQILINIAEAVKGSAFSMRTREYILRVGLVAILLIFVLSTYNDLLKIVKDWGGSWFG